MVIKKIMAITEENSDNELVLESIEEAVSEDVFFLVHLRDSGICQRPGCRAGGTECHHKIFRSQGGKDTLENLVLLCQEHHAEAHEEQEWRKHWENWKPKKYVDYVINEY